MNSVIKGPPEEFVQRHLNVIESINGHIYIDSEVFVKKQTQKMEKIVYQN